MPGLMFNVIILSRNDYKAKGGRSKKKLSNSPIFFREEDICSRFRFSLRR
jgi:hypothetical protein